MRGLIDWMRGHGPLPLWALALGCPTALVSGLIQGTLRGDPKPKNNTRVESRARAVPASNVPVAFRVRDAIMILFIFIFLVPNRI